MKSCNRGFTLLELLVAVAIVVVLVLLVAQLVQSGSSIIARSRGHLTADSQAREIFNRFGKDLAGMPMALDLAPAVSSQNDKLFFYSEAPGFSTETNSSNLTSLSLVGYRVNDNAQMVRLGRGLKWSGAESPVFLTYSTNRLATNSVPAAASTLGGTWNSVLGSAPQFEGTGSDYHLIADGVFRVAFVFQKNDGSYTLALGSDSTKGALNGVSSIIVTIAVLDSDSRKIVSDITNLSASLPVPLESDIANGVLPAKTWGDLVNNTSAFASAAGIPSAAAGKVRIYQRSFPLNMP